MNTQEKGWFDDIYKDGFFDNEETRKRRIGVCMDRVEQSTYLKAAEAIKEQLLPLHEVKREKVDAYMINEFLLNAIAKLASLSGISSDKKE